MEEIFPLEPSGYEVHEQVGHGVSATVFRAFCKSLKKIVAIKVLDLDRCNSNLDDIRREAQTMNLIDHPNVVRAYCSFVVDQHLWVVMPYMGGGSCLHIMKLAYPNGFEESVIASILREVLKALQYLHGEGHIHRDVKAGNILVDINGIVKLADFGVSACMFDTGDRQRSRKTFVGTPCWMAPEVMEQKNGYDFKADIWSFGITALELAHGHAPFSKHSPAKVFLETLRNAPPGLDYARDKKFSRSFREMISMCLVKDPNRRPSAEKLLKHSFFKQARSNSYIANEILHGLPPLVERIKILKEKDDDRLAQEKTPYGIEEEKSQNEYKRGISGWNFDLQELKSQAALIKDDDLVDSKMMEHKSLTQNSQEHKQTDSSLLVTDISYKGNSQEKEMNQSSESQQDPLSTSFSLNILNDSRKQFDLGKDDIHQKCSMIIEVNEKGNVIMENTVSSSIAGTIDDIRKTQQCLPPRWIAYSGPLISSVAKESSIIENNRGHKAPTNDIDDKAKKLSIQQKGRFKVTADSAEAETNGNANLHRRKSFKNVSQQLPPHPTASLNLERPTIPVSDILPFLQTLLQTNLLQKETIDHATRLCYDEALLGDASAKYLPDGGAGGSMDPTNREIELMLQIVDLQNTISDLTADLQSYQVKNEQLEKQLNSHTRKKNEE